MKVIFILAIVLSILTLIIDTAGALNAALNHNLKSLCFYLFLIELILLCLKINFENYKQIKNNKHEAGK